MKQEHQVGSLSKCISELQRQAEAQRLELQDAQYGYVESRREQVRPQEELSTHLLPALEGTAVKPAEHEFVRRRSLLLAA